MNNYHLNPYTEIPLWVCDDFGLPVMPVNQDCASYEMRLSQICGLVILPPSATLPTDWSEADGWEGVVDNSDTTGTMGRYLVGIGSFLPTDKAVIDLSGGRLVEVRERTYQLRFQVFNLDEGHKRFGRMLQNGYRNFRAWLEPLGGGLIGGAAGISPVFVDCDFPFEGASTSVQYIDITMDFRSRQFPDVSTAAFQFNVDPVAEDEGAFWGDPNAPDIWGDPGGNTGWGDDS
jgi:hypothetical protein